MHIYIIYVYIFMLRCRYVSCYLYVDESMFFNLNQDRTHMHCECVSGKVMVCPCDVFMALLLLEGQVSAATYCVYK